MSKRKTPDDDDKGGLPPSAAPQPPFENLRAHLEKLQRDGKLVKLLGEAWDSDDMRRFVHSKVGGWAPMSDDNEFRKYDWDVHFEEDERGIKLHFASNDVQLAGYGTKKKVDAKECSGGVYVNYDGGCQECRGEEAFYFNMEKKLDGTTRLKVNSYVTCRCGCMRDDDSVHCEETAFIALPRTSSGRDDESALK